MIASLPRRLFEADLVSLGVAEGRDAPERLVSNPPDLHAPPAQRADHAIEVADVEVQEPVRFLLGPALSSRVESDARTFRAQLREARVLVREGQAERLVIECPHLRKVPHPQEDLAQVRAPKRPLRLRHRNPRVRIRSSLKVTRETSYRAPRW